MSDVRRPWVGETDDIDVQIDHVVALGEAWSQPGVRTMQYERFRVATRRRGGGRRGARGEWAAPIGFTSGSVAGPESRQLSYLIGYDTATGYGGPARLTGGRAPTALGEAVLDEQARDLLDRVGLSHRAAARPSQTFTGS